MASFNLPVDQISILFFVFLRVTLILLFLPLFDNRSIPALFKVGLCFAISMLFIPLLNFDKIPDFSKGLPIVVGILSEVIMGLGIGLCVKLLFTGIQLGGQLCGFQMGLAIANVLDPNTGAQNSIVAQFYYIAAMLIFLTINGHHWFLQAMTDSFVIMPPFGFNLTESLMTYFLSLVGKMFVISIKVSAPVIVSMLFTSVCLGLVARTVPQMNVFFVAMPVKIIVGFIFIGLMLPMFSSYLVKMFNGLGTIILTFIKLGLG